jgi:hypothetical protein
VLIPCVLVPLESQVHPPASVQVRGAEALWCVGMGLRSDEYMEHLSVPLGNWIVDEVEQFSGR